MTKRTFESVVYTILAIGAFVVNYFPVSISCASILLYGGSKLFFDIFSESPKEVKKGYFVTKGVFLFIILLSLIVVVGVFMYRHKLTVT
jgi:ABC-type Na+ efflux pump permease subunit